MIQVETYPLGLIIQANCYLVIQDGHALVIDPGSKGRSVQKRIDDTKLIVDAVVLTHGHFDHCAGADEFVGKYHCPLYVHPDDKDMLKDPKRNFSADFAPLIVKSEARELKQGKQQIGTFQLDMIDAPGHSEGSCLLLMGNLMFCGDVLFQGSVGRTDLAGGSNTRMIQSLRMLKTLPMDYIVYPGHGPATTLSQELQTNPYLLSV